MLLEVTQLPYPLTTLVLVDTANFQRINLSLYPLVEEGVELCVVAKWTAPSVSQHSQETRLAEVVSAAGCDVRIAEVQQANWTLVWWVHKLTVVSTFARGSSHDHPGLHPGDGLFIAAGRKVASFPGSRLVAKQTADVSTHTSADHRLR